MGTPTNFRYFIFFLFRPKERYPHVCRGSHEKPCIVKITEKSTEEKYIHELEFQVGIYFVREW